MNHPRVLITDYAWPDLHVERSILEPQGVELTVAQHGDEDELKALATDVDVNAGTGCASRKSRLGFPPKRHDAMHGTAYSIRVPDVSHSRTDPRKCVHSSPNFNAHPVGNPSEIVIGLVDRDFDLDDVER